jgi:hypothetical protein
MEALILAFIACVALLYVGTAIYMILGITDSILDRIESLKGSNPPSH